MIRSHNATSVQVEATPAPGQVTQFLADAGAGDKAKFDALFVLVYPTLKKHAQHLERPGVAKTELVHTVHTRSSSKAGTQTPPAAMISMRSSIRR